jgi:tetrahydromethanopterin S-methyltransferase subunit G
MPADVTREEFDALEQEVEGEKLVTRHILEQTRNGDDLSAIRTRLDRVEHKVDEVAQEVGGVKHALNGLIRDLPKIVGEAVRKPSKRSQKG